MSCNTFFACSSVFTFVNTFNASSSLPFFKSHLGLSGTIKRAMKKNKMLDVTLPNLVDENLLKDL